MPFIFSNDGLTSSLRLAALPLLGFSPKILGFSIESWVLGSFPEGFGFSLVIFHILPKNTFISVLFGLKQGISSSFWAEILKMRAKI